jgi:glycosyltransferase involved in cell wall biosynthesis
LPIAAVAARRSGARLGFDCEDLLAERGTEPAHIVRMLERTYLSMCEYVSVPSRHVAERLRQQYRIPTPVVLYNTFPLDLAEGLPPPHLRPASSSNRLRLYWFGQTLGPGRGIEEAIAALGRLHPSEAELHLRGRIGPEFQGALDSLASEHGVQDRLVVHPLVPHDDTIRAAGDFDVGLALERPDNVNTSLTVSNKLFAYLLAGLAVGATDTPGQREVLDQIPSAGIVCPPDQPAELAFGIRTWARNRAALLNAQQQAWRAARERFSWDCEEHVFLRLFEAPTSGPVS